MSQLTAIRAALAENPEIKIVRTLQWTRAQEIGNALGHKVEFIVAPKKGLYTVKALQALLNSLTRGIKAEEKQKFSMSGFRARTMSFGVVRFEEMIGTATDRREIEITEPEPFRKYGFRKNKRVIERKMNLRRCIYIRLYPDVGIARETKREHNMYGMKVSTLKERAAAAARK